MPVLDRRVATPSALVTTVSEDCPDCATLRHTTADQPRPNDECDRLCEVAFLEDC